MSFNLARDPWIEVGAGRAVSIRDAIARSHETRRLGGTGAEMLVALRLLLAVAYRAYSDEIAQAPSPEEWWRATWRAGRMPEGPLDTYLSRWSDRFELFGDAPFYQAPALEREPGSESPMSLLLLQGSGHWLFASRRGLDGGPAEPDDAARLLLYAQGFDIGGIKPNSGNEGGGRQFAPKGPGKVGWCGSQLSTVLEGGSLFETIMLNLPLEDRSGRPIYALEGDLPPWELDEPPAKPARREPAGPVQALTWQSRRIRLFERDGAAAACAVSYGDVCEDDRSRMRDPMASRDLIGPMVRYKEHETWEHLCTVLGPSGPLNVSWAGKVAGKEGAVTVRTVGMVYDKFMSAVRGELDGSVVVPTAALAPGRESDVVRDAVYRMGRAIRLYAHFCVRAEGAQGDLRWSMMNSSMEKGGMLDDAACDARSAVDPIVRRTLASLEPGAYADGCLRGMAEAAGEIVGMAWERVSSRGMSLFSSHFADRDGGGEVGSMLAVLERSVRGTLGTLMSEQADEAPEKRPDPTPRKARGRKGRPVVRSADGEDVTYGSAAAAARDLVSRGEGHPSGNELNTYAAITRAVRSGGEAYGYTWRYADVEHVCGPSAADGATPR